MGSLTSDPLKPSLRSTTLVNQQMRLIGADEIISCVLGRMEDITKFLYTGLKEVYSREDREMIDNIRKLLDLENFLQLTKEMSPAVVSQRQVGGFLEAAEKIDEDFCVKYEKAEMRYQFFDFVQKITLIGLEKESDKISSLDIMVRLMNTEERLWRGCEGVLDILCQAAVKKTVESVVESWVSVLEHHSNKSRNLKSETIQSEMMIAINGPLVQHSQPVVEEAMTIYWRKMKKESLQNGHFTLCSENIKSFTVSKAVDSLNLIPVKTSFMI